jgi:ATP-binding cassette subfamily F protein uup
MATILSLEAIAKQFDERPLLRSVTLGIEPGERVGLVGVNGSGKTTLLRIAAGVEQPDSGRVSTARDLRVAYLPQNPILDLDLPALEQIFRDDNPTTRLLRAYEQATTALAHHPDDPHHQAEVTRLIEQIEVAGAWSLEQDARTILTKLGITDLETPVGQLSGGQRKRIAMAAALINPTDLLILDEPTNHIDTATVAWLESFLARMNAALLLVTHDRYFLDRVVMRIVEVDAGKIYSYPGNYGRFLEMKAERAAQQASDESRRQTILRKELVWLRRGAQARTTKQQARIDRIDAMQADTPEVQAGTLELSAVSRRIGKRAIELKRVGKAYGSRQLISDFTLSIGPTDRVGIIGPNGQGKTTLLNMIAGRVLPDTGEVQIGETVHMAYYDQESSGLNPEQRVIDYVKEGAELARTGEGDLITAAQMLERFLFPSVAHYSLIGKLSGGERRRLYLLRTLMAAPNVLLLDEPTNDLDIQTLTVLEDYLDTFQGVLVVVSHDRYFLDRTVERTLSFEDGQIVEYPGGYTSYAEARARRAAEQAEAEAARSKPKPAPTAANNPVSGVPRPRRLTFAEQRELGQLEQKIADLEARQAAIQTQISAGGDYQAIQKLSLELETVTATLEQLFERWSFLAELAEK